MSMFLKFQHRYPRPICLLEHVLSALQKKDNRLMLYLAYCRPITFHILPIPTNGWSAVGAQTANRFERGLLMQRRCNRLFKTTKWAINQIVPQHNNNVIYVSVQCHCRPASTQSEACQCKSSILFYFIDIVTLRFSSVSGGEVATWPSLRTTMCFWMKQDFSDVLISQFQCHTHTTFNPRTGKKITIQQKLLTSHNIK